MLPSLALEYTGLNAAHASGSGAAVPDYRAIEGEYGIRTPGLRLAETRSMSHPFRVAALGALEGLGVALEGLGALEVALGVLVALGGLGVLVVLP